MTLAFLLQTLASLVAIGLLVLLAAWAKISRPASSLDEESARNLMAEEFPDHAFGRVWVAADGDAAVARSEDEALLVYRSGDGYVARSLPWPELAKAAASGGEVAVKLQDLTAPVARLALAEGAAWPPLLGGARP